MVATGALLVVLLALLLLKPWRREQDAQLRQFQGFEQLLARHGVARHAGEGARDFAQRAAARLPGAAPQIQAFAGLYEQARYAGQPTDQAEMKTALRSLRRQLPWRARVSKPRGGIDGDNL
jgi:hypothetical protein